MSEYFKFYVGLLKKKEVLHYYPDILSWQRFIIIILHFHFLNQHYKKSNLQKINVLIIFVFEPDALTCRKHKPANIFNLSLIKDKKRYKI